MKYNPQIVISDIKTYYIMSNNQNYMDRLFEAYEYIKNKKINTYQKFLLSGNFVAGLFDYYEITIFDRLKNEEYKQLIKKSWQFIHKDTDTYVKNPTIGDELAGYGRK